MPTEPWRSLLDPEHSRLEASKALGEPLNLLRDIVSMGSQLVGCCSSRIPPERDAGIATASLYMHIVGTLDAIEIQVRELCGWPAIMHVRSAWEASLQLLFLLEQERLTDASLAWMVSAVRRKISAENQVLVIERRLRNVRRRGKGTGPGRAERAASAAARVRIDKLGAGLKKPHLARIAAWAAEPWYQHFGGGLTIEELAAKLRNSGNPLYKDLGYHILFRVPSSFVHGQDYDRFVLRGKDGHPEPQPLRGPIQAGRHALLMASSIGLTSSTAMLRRLRPDLLDEYENWYRAEIRDRFHALAGVINAQH